ncbi:hypothetical protein [Kocuria sp. BT304]|uniref:hypothetical protein n=1 Tax=Kocuria sp. BT304 TaxID=1702043 RepID=UPI0013A6BABB|nr:hypothetical protein [Kocuria sp. BT304]
MKGSSRVARDLTPSTLAGKNLAHYRLLLPLYNEEDDVYSRWSAFLPSAVESIEPLRNIDLYGLRYSVSEVGKDMDGWDSARGRVSKIFAKSFREALEEFVPSRATWTLRRWLGYRHDLPDATPVIIGDLSYSQEILKFDHMEESINELGMPEYMFDSTRQFGWGAPLFPDWGVATMSVANYIRHFAPRGFETFSVPSNAPLPDNLGD